MSKEFFDNSLKYAMANEDTFLERNMVLAMKSKKILSVCGSGMRAYPLITESCDSLDLVDLSQMQLSWADLRRKTISELCHEDYLSFWGYRPLLPKLRQQKYSSLLGKSNEEIFALFNHNEWQAPIEYGVWEKTYRKLYQIVNFFVGNKWLHKLEQTKTLEEQNTVFFHPIFKLKWHGVLYIVGNKTLFNSLMYKGNFIKKNIKLSYVRFYQEAFDRLFKNNLLKDCFFLQLSFLGNIKNLSGVPCEAQAEVYLDIKKYIDKVAINFLNIDLIEHLATGSKNYDFLSLSDVPSYFDDELGETFLQKIKPSIALNGIVVVRYYLRIYHPFLDGFEDITTQFENGIKAEKTQMYQVKIYKRLS